MSRPRGPVREVTTLRRRVLQVLVAHETEWLSARAVHAETRDWLSGTHNALRVLTLLGWVEIQVDLDQRVQHGTTGRRTRRRFRVTEAGKTALRESEGETDG